MLGTVTLGVGGGIYWFLEPLQLVTAHKDPVRNGANRCPKPHEAMPTTMEPVAFRSRRLLRPMAQHRCGPRLPVSADAVIMRACYANASGDRRC